jgi:hypothetical protein
MELSGDLTSATLAGVALIFSIVNRFSDRHTAKIEALRVDSQQADDKLKNMIESKTAQTMAECAACKLELSKLELAITKELREYPTNGDLEQALKLALSPVLAYMERSEEIMDEILRSGLLSNGRRHAIGPNLPGGPAGV